MRRLSFLWLCFWFVPAAGLALGNSAGLFQGFSLHRLQDALKPPTLAHPLGFDAFGRDLFLMTLDASILRSLFALAATLVAMVFAFALGLAASVAPGSSRFALERFLETLLAFPSLLFALAWAAVRGPGWDTLAVALLLGSVPMLTRLVLVRSREILAEDYVTASRSLGASSARIAISHLAPGVAALCRVKTPNLFASALLAEASLSFLGLGAPLGRNTWGSLLAQGKDYLLEAPHLAIGSGLPLVLTLLCLHGLSPGASQSRKFL